MDESHCRHLIEHYLQAYNRFDIDAMLAVLAHSVRFENHSGGQLTMVTEGIDAFGELARQSAPLFREREQRLLELIFKDGVVLASIDWRGVFAQDIPMVPARVRNWHCRDTASSLLRTVASCGSSTAVDDQWPRPVAWTEAPAAVESAQHYPRVPGKDVRMLYQVLELPRSTIRGTRWCR